MGLLVAVTGTLSGDTGTSALRVDTSIGWSGLVKRSTWNPLIVEIENTGAPGKFVLVVEVETGTSSTANRVLTLREHFELSGGDRKRFDLVIPIERVGVPVTVSIRENGADVYREEHSLSGKSFGAPLVVVLSRRTAFDFIMPESMAVYPHPERLPTRWDAYLGVDLIVLHDAEWGKLHRAQIEAMEAWIDIGGSAVIVGGSHLGFIERSFRSMIPVDVDGIYRSNGEMSTSGDFVIPDLGKSLVSRFEEIDGDASVLAADGEIPTLVSKRRGAGNIIAMAFDPSAPPFSVWPGRDDMWREIVGNKAIQSSRAIGTQSDHTFEDPTVTSLVNETESGAYGRLIYLFFMAAFVSAVYVALGYVGAKPRSSLRWGAFVVVLAAGVVGASYLFIETLFRRNYLIVSSTIVEYHSEARFARSTSELMVVSSTIATNRLTLELDRSIVMPRTRKELMIDRIDGDLEISTLHEAPWSKDSFTIDTMLPMYLSTKRDDDADSVHVSIDNSTSHLLLGGTIIYRGSIRPTDPLVPGDQLSVSLPRSDDEAVSDLTVYRQRYGSMMSPTREATITDLLMDDHWRSLLERDAVLYLGWVNTPLLQLETADTFRHYTSSDLIVVVLEAGDADV